ncbi:MAG: hypothetical protein PVF27_00575 [Gemmatimonadales bacterium]
MTAQTPTPRKAPATTAFTLLGAGSAWVTQGNRVVCGLRSRGDLCAPVEGYYGAVWPAGTMNSYIHHSGLLVAGILPRTAAMPWAGDTVAAFFWPGYYNPSGEAVTPIHSSRIPEDGDRWPAGAVIRDAEVYHSALLGRDAISEEDTWVLYYDGPGLLSNRDHPMGILIEQRTLQWDYPLGNEDILYVVFTLTNITASEPAAYAGLAPAIRDDVAEIANRWVAETEERLETDLPAGGYRVDSLFVALGVDPSVGHVDFARNAASAILPFDMGLAYATRFYEPGSWPLPPDIATEPFGPRPGFVGSAFLRTPRDAATGDEPHLALFSTLRDWRWALDAPSLWRSLSGNIDLAFGDYPCDIGAPRDRRLCDLLQQPDYIRFYQSTGPFSLDPGQSETIVLAYVFAGAIDSIVAPYVGLSPGLRPGIPPADTALADGRDTPRTLDRAAGWVSHADVDGSGAIEPDEVETVPRSLLAKVQLARTLADNGFLLPTAPAAPDFFLVPGDDRVTVVWQRSPTEETGDPYFAVASDPTSGAYDPNYRRLDVEGYRLYRGRSPAALELVAQFDYAGTTFVDHMGAWDYGGQCAPELGVTDQCPTLPVSHQLAGAVTQVRPGDRILTTNGVVVVLERDSALADAGFPPLTDTGVPFAFVDSTVTNGFAYYYAVTTFDVNSIQSGPTTLESPILAKSVMPRSPAGNVTQVVASAGVFGRERRLLPHTEFRIDPVAGTFTRPPPPTNLVSVALDLFVPTAVAPLEATLTIDSVVPTYYDGTYYATLTTGGVHRQLTYTGLPIDVTDIRFPREIRSYEPVLVELAADPDAAARQGQAGLPFAGRATIEFGVGRITVYSGDAEWHDDVDGAFWAGEGLNEEGGSRWFSGDNETLADPTLPMVGGGVGRGELPGVTTIFSPQPIWSRDNPYQPGLHPLFRRIRQSTWHAARQADVTFYWGATPGTLDSVIDLTHDVVVPFNASTTYQAGWGFRDDIGGDDGSLAYTPPDGIVTYADFIWGPCVDGGLPGWAEGACETRPLRRQATLEPVDVTGDRVADGTGFALYFSHEFYIFQTDALPANTVWTHRSYFGDVRLSSSDSVYSYRQEPANPAVPGLIARITVDSAAGPHPTTADDLSAVHTVPDPFYYGSAYQTSGAERVIRFVNLPDRAIVRIYSLSGVLVALLEHTDPVLGGDATWDARNHSGRLVASGVYFYHVETPNGAEKIGRMTIVSGTGHPDR